MALVRNECLLAGKQELDIGGDVVNGFTVADQQAQAALPVEGVTSGRVVNAVAAGQRTRMLDVKHLEIPRYRRRRGFVTVQADEVWMKGRDVLGKKRWCITRRIQRDEDDLYLAGTLSELPQRIAQRGQCRRAYVGTLCIAEEKEYYLALEIGQTTSLTQVVGQRKVFPPLDTGNVGGFENGCLMTAGQQQAEEKSQEGEQFHLVCRRRLRIVAQAAVTCLDVG